MSGARLCHYPDRCAGDGGHCVPAAPCPLVVPPSLWAITDNGEITSTVFRDEAAALAALRTLDARYPNHAHGIIALYPNAA